MSLKLYENYLLMIRDNLIRCGVGLPVKDDYTYEELFNLSEEIDQILWYYRVLAIANSRDRLKDFIFPMDRTYVSYMRNIFYKEYCESKKDRREVTISGLVPNTDVGYEYRDTDEDEEELFEKSFDEEKETNGSDEENEVNSSTDNDLSDEDLDEIWGNDDVWGTDEDDSENDSDSINEENSENEPKSSVNTDKSDIEQMDSDLKELQDSVIYVTMDMLEIDEKGFYVYSTEDDEDAEDEDPFGDDSNDTLWEDNDEESEFIKDMDDSEDDFQDRDSDEEDEEDEDNGSDIPNEEEDEDDIFSGLGDDEPDEDVNTLETVDDEDDEDVDFPENEDVEDDEDDIPDNEDDEDEVDFPEDENGVDSEEKDEDEDIPDNGDSEDVDDEDDFPDLDSEDEEDSDDAEDFPDWNDKDNQDNDDDDIDFSGWDEDQDDEDEEKVKHSVNKNKGSIKGDKPTPSKKDGVGSKGNKSSEGVQDSFEHTRDEQFVESFDKVINDTLNFGRKSGKKIINKIWKGMTNQE